MLSVVLAGSSESIADALMAVERSCKGLAAELIVMVASDGEMVAVLREAHPAARVVSMPEGTVTPVMWGEGLRLTQGRVVAFTTSQMRVGANWATALLAGFGEAGESPFDGARAAASDGTRVSGEPGAALVFGVGGPIALGERRSAAADAAYFLRFSAFMPTLWSNPAPARDIPGDNAAYLREAIMRHAELLAEGFWEVEFHRRFERDGSTLLVVPSAEASMTDADDFGSTLRQRWQHAKTFGGSRVARHGESRAKIALLAPLVPFVLLWRIGRRVFLSHRGWWRFVRASPWLAALAVSWAAGEAAGAVRA